MRKVLHLQVRPLYWLLYSKHDLICLLFFSVASSGGGSGGAVVIQANSFTNIGLITVKGGDANITAWKIMNNTVFSNAAGGGGRVAIYVSLCHCILYNSHYIDWL